MQPCGGSELCTPSLSETESIFMVSKFPAGKGRSSGLGLALCSQPRWLLGGGVPHRPCSWCLLAPSSAHEPLLPCVLSVASLLVRGCSFLLNHQSSRRCQLKMPLRLLSQDVCFLKEDA